jgi:hypothetical protein
MSEPRQWNRRHVLKTAAAASFATALRGNTSALAANPDLIKNENAKLGTREWIAKNVRIAPETNYRSPWRSLFGDSLDRSGKILGVNPPRINRIAQPKHPRRQRTPTHRPKRQNGGSSSIP